MIVSPLLMQGQIMEVDYGTFMKMTEEKNIGRVQMDSSEIIFTDKENTQIYSTGIMYDPELTQRLYDTMTGMQWGKIADTKGWIVPVCKG